MNVKTSTKTWLIYVLQFLKATCVAALSAWLGWAGFLFGATINLVTVISPVARMYASQ